MIITTNRLPHQKLVFQSNASNIALVTGYGGGKTLCGALWIVFNSMVDNYIPHMAVSPNFVMARKTIIPAIIQILEEEIDPPLVKGQDYKYNKSEFHFEINLWGGNIWIGSAEKPDSLKGPNLGSALLDEPGLMDKMAWKNMVSRVRHPESTVLKKLLTGTPEGLNWFYDLCEGEDKPKDFELIRGKTVDNTFLPQSFINDLYDQYDEILVRAYINGEFVNLKGMSAYYSYSESNIIDSYTPDYGRPIYIGMDFNYDPMCSVVAQKTLIDGRECLIIFEENYFRNCDTDAAAERIFERHREARRIELYPDPACKSRTGHGTGKSDINMLRKVFGANTIYHVPSQSPLRKDRINSVNRMFCNSDGVRRIFITKNCRYLQKDLTHITMEEYLNGNIKDKMLGHITDALGYMISYMYPIRARSGYRYNKDFIA